MGYRLLDWFKQLHDEGIKERHMQKRNSKKKELRLSSKNINMKLSILLIRLLISRYLYYQKDY